MNIIEGVNLVAVVIFFVLMALAIFRMGLRVINYYRHQNRPSIILRRDIALMGSLFISLGLPLFIQAVGMGDLFFDGGPLRLEYTLVRDILGLSGMGYWVWAEYFVIGATGKEED